MSYIVFSYDWSSRELRRIIVSLLKSGNAIDIKKFNYVQSFSLEKWWNIKKSEVKFIMISTNDELRLLKFLEKYPQLKKVVLN